MATEMTLLRQAAFINGQWRSGQNFDVTNPATGAVVGAVPDFGAAETEDAVAAAARALPAWKGLLAKERSRILRRWFDLITEHTQELAAILTAEQGKPLAEAQGEIVYGAGFIEFYAEEAKRVYGEILPSHKSDARITVLRQPVGVVAAITPWNFPVAMITRKIAPALAVGCTVVCKPSKETPLSAIALAVLAEKAGFPAGVLNVVTGQKSAIIGQSLVTHPEVRCLAFTGSTDVGKTLMAAAAPGLKKLALELGGNAPFIVFDDADLDQAVEGLMASKFRNMGQTCVCANRIFVQENVHSSFKQKLMVKIAALKLGDGAAEGVTQGPLINEKAIEKVEAHVAEAVQKGAKICVGGKRAALHGNFYEPTLLTDVTPDMRMCHEETFGPVAGLIKFKTESEVIAMANATPFGLASYFYSRDIGRVWRVAEALESGMVGVNEGLISTELAPFGGIKESGWGREGSAHGIEEFTELKYVLMGGIERNE